MPFKKGQVNGCGKKGRSGRKPLHIEVAQIQDLHDIWAGNKTKKELQKIIDSGKYGAKHVFAAKAMSGDMRALNKLADKLYANKSEVLQDVTGEVKHDVTVSIDIMKSKPKK